ncbi:uncharacterized protein LOC133195519 [Saccostrea echinata]|uniref:uncharacterized protein LOC133195519 n=1 Tax=Saccostrea echinata TaxID=191078 RepID=UPI002A800E89|nr:uncharacterized protein LOC133195519 [Saccostrea echinata]
MAIIDREINDLLEKNIIEPVTNYEEGEFISNIFMRPKKNGKFRVILNLKQLNDCVEYHHFKMETLSAAVGLVSKNCFFASIDLQDAYYSCPVCTEDRKYLRFLWNDRKYQYTCLAMELASAPRIFTKLLKPVFSTLRKRGHANIAYIDDSLLVSKTESECRKNVRETAELLDSLGLTINVERSVFTPSRAIQFLGFIKNSELMTVSLTPDRATSIRQKCEEILKLHRITIREFAQLIGKLVSSDPGVRYAPLFCKSLEIVKDKELKTNAGNFDAKFVISGEIRKTITWWINNVERFPRFINIDKPVLAGLGIFNENNGDCYQGEWLDEDKEKHINFLELKFDGISAAENYYRQSIGDSNCSNMADTALVSTAASIGLQGQLSVAGHSKSSDDAEQTREVPPTEKNETGRIPCIGESFKNRGLSDDTQKILLSSWRESTKKQYRAYIEKWLSFCNSRQINVFEANVNNVLSFLTELFQSGLGYSCLNTARSALSSFLQLENCVNIGSHPLIRRFMGGVFVLRPALPRYNVTWDVNIVLKYLKSLSPFSSLSLLQLSQKLVMLLALLSGQRGQTLHLIDIRNVHFQESGVKIVIGDLLKTSNTKRHLGEIELTSYEVDKDLCVVNTLTNYLQNTETLRGAVTRLFITSQRLHKSVSRDTIGRWLKSVLKMAGIDISIFKPHSTRVASASAAHALRIPVDTIMRTVGWSRESTFRKFYNKEVTLTRMNRTAKWFYTVTLLCSVYMVYMVLHINMMGKHLAPAFENLILLNHRSFFDDFKSYTCPSNISTNDTEDILCMEREEFLRNFKNPCWFKFINTTVGLKKVLRCFPFFHIFGVCKSGTTDLFFRLTQHLQILNNSGILNKETQFWSWKRYGQDSPVHRNLTLDEFSSFFMANKIGKTKIGLRDMMHYSDIITGHADPMDFWDHNHWREIPQNDPNSSEPKFLTPHLVRHVQPNIKLKLLLREPAERLYSHYLHGYYGYTPLDFHNSVIKGIELFNTCLSNCSLKTCLYISDLSKDMQLPLTASLYFIHLQEWLDVFPREQLLVLRTEDYHENMKYSLLQLFSFLGEPNRKLAAIMNDEWYLWKDASFKFRAKQIPKNQTEILTTPSILDLTFVNESKSKHSTSVVSCISLLEGVVGVSWELGEVVVPSLVVLV